MLKLLKRARQPSGCRAAVRSWPPSGARRAKAPSRSRRVIRAANTTRSPTPIRNPNTYGGTSTYTVVDAKFTFRPTKRTELGIGVDNLFDHRYYVFHPYAGRTVYVEGRIEI